MNIYGNQKSAQQMAIQNADDMFTPYYSHMRHKSKHTQNNKHANEPCTAQHTQPGRTDTKPTRREKVTASTSNPDGLNTFSSHRVPMDAQTDIHITITRLFVRRACCLLCPLSFCPFGVRSFVIFTSSGRIIVTLLCVVFSFARLIHLNK